MEEEKGKHNPITLLREIFITYDKKYLKILNDYSNISIIVPCLNESKTLKKVCEELENLNLYFKNNLLTKEIIIVDASSSDNSDQILRKRKKIKYYKIDNLGRGNSIRYGFTKAKGDIVIPFVSDDEYSVNEIQNC